MAKLPQDKLDQQVELLVNIKRSYATLAKQNITKAQRRQKDTYDKRHNTGSTRLDLKDKVLLKNSKNEGRKGGKMDIKWTGPYTISECLGKGRFRLQNKHGVALKQTIHASRLKRYCQPWSTGQSSPSERSGHNDAEVVVC